MNRLMQYSLAVGVSFICVYYVMHHEVLKRTQMQRAGGRLEKQKARGLFWLMNSR